MEVLKKFREYSSDLIESGMAFNGIQTNRIKRENIQPTIDAVLQKISKFGFRKSDVTPLGSTGKKTDSGDIDLGVHFDPLMKSTGAQTTVDALKKFQTYLSGIYHDVRFLFGNQLSMPVPVYLPNGQLEGTFCQLDMMFTPSLAVSSFYYHSPAQGQSQYKGAVRTMLLMAIALESNNKWLNDNTKERYWFDKWYGLLRGTEQVIGSKRVVSEKAVVTDVPEEIVQILLGPKFKISDTNSFESLWKAIHSPNFVNKADLSKIESTFKSMMAKNGFEIPKGI